MYTKSISMEDNSQSKGGIGYANMAPEPLSSSGCHLNDHGWETIDDEPTSKSIQLLGLWEQSWDKLGNFLNCLPVEKLWKSNRNLELPEGIYEALNEHGTFVQAITRRAKRFHEESESWRSSVDPLSCESQLGKMYDTANILKVGLRIFQKLVTNVKDQPTEFLERVHSIQRNGIQKIPFLKLTNKRIQFPGEL